ncbi:hypothetical protein LCGC14_2192200 [marine sediment metagenome]|uniref:Uncharacterized protein n=1 Tax=marine sediment metagenome TaxID=412755 RepID=A0A0F9FWP2_9ZZZZ
MAQADKIMEALQGGPLDIQELKKATGIGEKSMQARLYDLRQKDLVARSEEGEFRALATARPTDEVVVNTRTGEIVEKPADHSGAQTQPVRQPLTGDRARFMELLKDCDVRKGLDTIVESVFTGDPENMAFVLEVLEDSRAMVNSQQRRMIIRHWARYMQSTLPDSIEERLRNPDAAPSAGGGEALMEDIGWKVEKDRDHEFVPKPSGPLTYEKALRHAATMNAVGRSNDDDDDDDDEEEEAVSTRGRKGKKGGGVEGSILTLLLKRAFPEKPEGDDRLDRALAEIERLKDDKHTDAMEAMQAQIAALANRSPAEEYQKAKDTISAIAGPPQVQLGDGSPAALLIKDTGDKLENALSRVAGLFERVLLREGQFVPEEADAAALEAQAADVLSQMEEPVAAHQSEESVVLRGVLWPNTIKG